MFVHSHTTHVGHWTGSMILLPVITKCSKILHANGKTQKEMKMEQFNCPFFN